MTLQTSGTISLADVREEFIGLIKDPYPTDIYFKPDGTKLYVLGGGNQYNAIDTIYSYDLSVAYDISTITFSGKIYLGYDQVVDQGTGIFFKPDGTEMYVMEQDGVINKFTLGTAWNITTASYSTAKLISGGNGATGLFFKPDGMKMYITSLSNTGVIEYNMSTAWDISTLTSAASYDPIITTASPYGLFFKPDGTKMYMLFDDAIVREFNLSTAWSVSTASSVTSASISWGTSATGISFNSDGSKLYVINTTTDGIDSYTLAATWTFTSGLTQSTFNTFPQTAYSLSEFYRGGAYVAGIAENLNIPTSGAISLSNFYGAKKYIPFATKLTFTADTTFTVPTGVTTIRIKAWGGGGGYRGAGGGFAKGDFTVTPGNVLAIRIGGGGGIVTAAAGGFTTAAANGGGKGYKKNDAGFGAGGGGGYSGVFTSNTVSQANALLVAAGGGGGALGSSDSTYIASGGGGGGLVGSNGITTNGTAGAGGTQSAGGSIGGGALIGGDSPSGTVIIGGGGGGYFGGGTGQGGYTLSGGGGSSYTKSGATNTQNTSGANGPGGLAPTSDSDYVVDVGKGGAQGVAGNAGYVVIYW